MNSAKTITPWPIKTSQKPVSNYLSASNALECLIHAMNRHQNGHESDDYQQPLTYLHHSPTKIRQKKGQADQSACPTRGALLRVVVLLRPQTG